VLTVEEGPAGPSPRLESDLSFLAFDGPRIASEGPYTEPGTICRTYVYRLRIVSAPAEVPFLGTIKVVDPWEQSRPISLNVQGDAKRPIRLMPSTLTIGEKGRDEASEAQATFFVLLDGPSVELLVEPEGAETSPIEITRSPTNGSQRMRKYTVRLRADRPRNDRVHRVNVRLGPSGPSATLTIILSRGGD
jgi:hypothetical protein